MTRFCSCATSRGRSSRRVERWRGRVESSRVEWSRVESSRVVESSGPPKRVVHRVDVVASFHVITPTDPIHLGFHPWVGQKGSEYPKVDHLSTPFFHTVSPSGSQHPIHHLFPLPAHAPSRAHALYVRANAPVFPTWLREVPLSSKVKVSATGSGSEMPEDSTRA